MSSAKFVNITRLMTSYNFEFEEIPDNLKCAECKLVLKDACHLPCGCTFCRVCVDDMMLNGSQFCPGVSEECAETLLSTATPNYSANKSISKLTVKCHYNDCVYKCQLVNMGDHLLECQRKRVECPFHQFGCNQDNLPAEGMNRHLQQDHITHNEILIRMIANIKIESEGNRREIDILFQREEGNEKVIEMFKSELVLKDGQIRTLMDQMIHVQNENKSMKNDIKSIEEDKANLADQLRILSDNINRETDERREDDELDSARVIDYVDKEITTITDLIGSNKEELKTDMKSFRDNMQSIEDNIHDMTSQMQSIKALMGLDQVDARFEWGIDADVEKSFWYSPTKVSANFTGAVHPYKYQLSCANGLVDNSLRVYLRIHPGPGDKRLTWPFEGRVIISVAEKGRHDVCRTISQLCRIQKPPDKCYKRSDPFEFPHSELKGAGLNLSRGVRVSCVIPLDAEQVQRLPAHNIHNEVQIID